MTALTLTDSEFRALAAQITDLAAGYLSGLDAARAYPQVSGAEVARAFAEPLPETGLGAAALGALGAVLERSRAPNRPLLRLRVRFRRASGGPRGPAGQRPQPERHRLALSSRGRDHRARRWYRRLAAAIGCAGFSGSLCGGGSMANLMGLAMAREARRPGQRARRAPGGGVRLLGSPHVDPQGHGTARTRACQPAPAARGRRVPPAG